MKHIIFLLFLSLIGTGCGFIKSTKKVYHEYINQADVPDLNGSDGSDQNTRAMARLFTPMDKELHDLSRTLSSQETFPNQEWFDQVLSRYQWLGGVGAVDKEGSTIFSKQNQAIKIQDFSILLEDLSDVPKELVGGIQPSDFGPECYIGQPFSRDNTWMGLLAVHFDFRDLASYSPNPKKLLILSGGIVLWKGEGFEEAALLKESWSDKTEDDSDGYVKTESTTYYWVARYIGSLQIIYIAKVS